MVNGQWSVVNGQWSMVSGQWFTDLEDAAGAVPLAALGARVDEGVEGHHVAHHACLQRTFRGRSGIIQ
jgi:hypothetical protein